MQQRPKVCLETYGCSFNASDSEAMAGVLEQEGYEIVTSPQQADLLVINTCTVKDRTYLNFEKRLAQLKQEAQQGTGPRLVIAGCIPKAYERTDLLEGVSAIGPDTLDQIGQVVRQTLQGQSVHLMRNKNETSSRQDRALLPTRRKDPFIEILPISRGCLSACSFCQTRLARGRLVSFRPGDILNRARQALEQGVTQIWVTSQDTGAYGKDCDYPLWRLLENLCNLEGDFRVRLGMTSPIWIWQDLDPMLKVFDHPKLFRFLHIPVQSGSDRILAAMKRGNTVAQFEAVCEAFVQRHAGLALMTDLIVGFPGEQEEDFQATLDLVDRLPLAAINRSKFSARPGTAAAQLTPLPSAVLSERSKILYNHVRRACRRFHRPLVGQTLQALASQHLKGGQTVAYTESYRPVILPQSLPLGRWIDVKCTATSDFHVKAKSLSLH